jgi:DNA-binding MarR family transcriptional regulator
LCGPRPPTVRNDSGSTILCTGQSPFLRALYREDGINQETLAKRLLFNKATIARAIDKLEYAGYVSRTRDECDRKANKIYLTSNAWDIKPAMDQISNEWNLILTSGFTEIEKILIKELMKTIVSSVMCEMEQEDITVLSELMK